MKQWAIQLEETILLKPRRSCKTGPPMTTTTEVNPRGPFSTTTIATSQALRYNIILSVALLHTNNYTSHLSRIAFILTLLSNEELFTTLTFFISQMQRQFHNNCHLLLLMTQRLVHNGRLCHTSISSHVSHGSDGSIVTEILC